MMKQLEELAPDDPLFNDDWIAKVSTVESMSEVNEYLLSRINDPPSDLMFNTALVEDCLEKSKKYVTKRETTIRLDQLTISSNQHMVHADVHGRKEAVTARKSSGAFNQSQHIVKSQVDRGMMNIQELYQLK